MRRPILFTTALLLSAGSALAQGTTSGAGTAAAHAATVVPADSVTWGPAPAALPAGARLAVLEGDPTKPGPYTIRLRLPAGYWFPPHSHPGAEHVTVMSGALTVGMGDRADQAQTRTLPAGSYGGIPADVRHYATAEGETVVQIHGVGPFGIAYVHAADDPRPKAGPQR